MRTAARAAIAAAALALGQGCGISHCEELADHICGCLAGPAAQDYCRKQVQAQLNRDPKPGSDAEAYCASKLATCPSPGADPSMCDRLNTCQGKVDCGLAYDCPSSTTTP